MLYLPCVLSHEVNITFDQRTYLGTSQKTLSEVNEPISLVVLQNHYVISTSSSIIGYSRLIMLVPTTLSIC